MSCSAGDINCRLDEIVAALQPGRDAFDGWTLGVAIASVVASSVLAFMAYRASASAVDIAEKADRRENDRDREREQERLDRYLAELLVASAEYRDRVDAWRRGTERGIELPDPGIGQLLALVDAMRIVAPKTQRPEIEEAAERLRGVRFADIRTQADEVGMVVSWLRDWRRDLDKEA